MSSQNVSNSNDANGGKKKRTPANASRQVSSRTVKGHPDLLTRHGQSCQGVQTYGALPKVVQQAPASNTTTRVKAMRKDAAKKAAILCDVLPDLTKRKHAKRPVASINDETVEPLRKTKQMKATQPTLSPMKVDAEIPLRHLSRGLSLQVLRARLGQRHLKNIFDQAREGKFGNVTEPGPERQKGIRKMFQRMVKDTKDGNDTVANAEYFVQILEEGWPSGEGVQEFPFLAVKIFKLLIILISYLKPPPAPSESDSLNFVAMTPQQVLDIVSKEMRDALRVSLQEP